MNPILFSYDVFAEQVYGGVSRYFAELHGGLVRRGHASWILTGLYVNEYSDDVGETGIAAVKDLFARAASAHLIPADIHPEFV